jgi:cardiolipin synthase
LRMVALAIFLFAGVSDILDGFIARKFDQRTQLGAMLDPLADKAILISAFVCLFIMREQFGPVQLPFWLLIVVISRDLILLGGAVMIHLLNMRVIVEPTAAGKLTTFFQALAVFGIFFQWDLSFVIWGGVLVLAVVTTIDYIKRNLRVVAK